MIKVVQDQAGAQRPLLPAFFTGRFGEQALIGDDHHAIGKLQARVEVDFNVGLRLFVGGQLGLKFSSPVAGERQFVASGVVFVGGRLQVQEL